MVWNSFIAELLAGVLFLLVKGAVSCVSESLFDLL